MVRVLTYHAADPSSNLGVGSFCSVSGVVRSWSYPVWYEASEYADVDHHSRMRLEYAGRTGMCQGNIPIVGSRCELHNTGWCKLWTSKQFIEVVQILYKLERLSFVTRSEYTGLCTCVNLRQAWASKSLGYGPTSRLTLFFALLPFV